MKKPYISGWVILFGIILPILIASLLISFYFFNSFTLFMFVFILSPVIFVVLYASTHPSIQGWIIMAVTIIGTVYSFVTKTIWSYAVIIFWLSLLLVILTAQYNMKKLYKSGWVILFGIILPAVIGSYFISHIAFTVIFALSPIIFVVLYVSTHPSIQGWIIMAGTIIGFVYSLVTKTIWPYADIIFWLGPLLVVMTTPNNSSLLASFLASFLEGSGSTDGDDSFAEMQSYRYRDIEGERERYTESGGGRYLQESMDRWYGDMQEFRDSIERDRRESMERDRERDKQ